MSGKFNGLAVVSLTRNTVFINLVDPLTRLNRAHVLPLDYDALNDIGVVTAPQRLAATLRDFFTTQKLTCQVRAAIHLKYLDLRHLYFPVIPDDELDQIVRDEAVRESIFSFSGEAVAVAYQLTGIQNRDSGGARQEVLAATTHQAVIDTLSETFALAELKLLSIQPNVEGFTLFWQTRPKLRGPVVLLNVLPEQTEFYIWEERRLAFWRHLPVGDTDPGGLGGEVRVSLEHYQRRNSDATALRVETIYILGTQVPLQLGETLQTDYIAGDVQVDLQALALQEPESEDFCFWERSETALNWLNLDYRQLWPYVLVVLVGLNLWGGWRNYRSDFFLRQVRKDIAELEKEKRAQEKQLRQLQATQSAFSDRPLLPVRVDLLLEDIRRMVPERMRFTKTVVDRENNRLQIEGVCLDRTEIDPFIQGLKRLKGFQNYRLIEMHPQTGYQLATIGFRVELELGVNTP